MGEKGTRGKTKREIHIPEGRGETDRNAHVVEKWDTRKTNVITKTSFATTVGKGVT